MSDTAESEVGEIKPALTAAPVPSPAAETWLPGRLSVVFKLTLLVGITVALLLAVVLTAGWLYWSKAARARMEAQLTAVAVSRRDTVRAQLSILSQRVEQNTDRGEFRGFFYELANHQTSPQNQEGSLVSLKRIADQKPIIAAYLVDQTGLVVLSTDPTEIGRNLVGKTEFQQGLSGPVVGRPHLVKQRYESILCAPIRNRNGPSRVYGVLFARADVSALQSALSDVSGLGKTGETLLGVRVGGDMKFLFPPRNAPEIAKVPVDAAPALRDAVRGQDTFARVTDYRGVPVLAAGRSIGYDDWAVVVKMDEKEAEAPLAEALRLEILAGLVVMAAGLAAAYALALSFTRPVRRLAQAASRLKSGDFSVSVLPQSADEFGVLATSFNEMVRALRMRSEERDHLETALRDTDRRKDEFLAMLGHELRNPLSAIANATRLAQQLPHDAVAADLARGVIARQTDTLHRLVDDLLDVARISEGRIELRRTSVDVGMAIRRAIEASQPLLTERRHTLDLSLAGSGQRRVDGDAVRIEQVVTNLLINAIKYTPDGGHITLSERHEPQEVVITVNDDGIGIAPEMLPKIFELFTQADRSLDRDAGGLGIGLHLCRHLVSLHGGQISAQSVGPGRGSTFTVRLPTVPAEPAAVFALEPRLTALGPSRRILLVDDNRDAVRSLSRLLALRGHQVATAFDGLEAIEAAHEFKPDVFLLDIGLPGLDGYALARRLRAEGFAHAPMIAISGYAQDQDRARSREAGFTHHFAKPVDFDALAELINAEPIGAVA